MMDKVAKNKIMLVNFSPAVFSLLFAHGDLVITDLGFALHGLVQSDPV
jgi:hypothetical protein